MYSVGCSVGELYGLASSLSVLSLIPHSLHVQYMLTCTVHVYMYSQLRVVTSHPVICFDIVICISMLTAGAGIFRLKCCSGSELHSEMNIQIISDNSDLIVFVTSEFLPRCM